ncbi:MAG TPA: ribulose-phosphate 3-epimerase, partial [Clostridia bacterium]
MVMLMAINPGIVGHKLIPSMLDKISDLKKFIEEEDIVIGVDGGVTFDSAPKMIKNGATFLVCGTQTIFKQEASITKKLSDLRKKLTVAV